MSSFASRRIQPTTGQRVKVVDVALTLGITIPRQFMITRKLDSTGVIQSHVPRTQKQVWYVEHDNGTVGAYSLAEIVPENEAGYPAESMDGFSGREPASAS